MSMATSSIVPNHIVLEDISWSAYSGLLKAFAEKHVPHVYQRGRLEMMSPSHGHEHISRFLARLIDAASYQMRIEVMNVGSATRRHQKSKQGIEPDESFYIGEKAVIARKLSDAEARRLPPDLAIEIEWSRAVLDKLKAYSALGVREVWRCNRKNVEFLVLSDSGNYEAVERSIFFSRIDSKTVSNLVRRMKDTDQLVLLDEFLGSLRKSKRS
jgi:Uma2 family endonuclease